VKPAALQAQRAGDRCAQVCRWRNSIFLIVILSPAKDLLLWRKALGQSWQKMTCFVIAAIRLDG
jgi:hypothetical protein